MESRIKNSPRIWRVNISSTNSYLLYYMSKKNSSLILLSQTIGICYAFCLAACFKDGRTSVQYYSRYAIALLVNTCMKKVSCPCVLITTDNTFNHLLHFRYYIYIYRYYENISPVREFQFQCITVMLSVHSETSPQQAYPAGHVPHTNVKRAHQEATLWSRRLFLSICATQLCSIV